MFSYSDVRRLAVAAALVASLVINSDSFAQDRFEIEFGDVEMLGGAMVFKGFEDALAQGSVSLSTTVQDGVRITRGSSSTDGQFEIRVEEGGEIAVTLTREYGIDDADELMESHPELYMYLKAIPREIGESKVKIKFEVTTTYTADDEPALKEKNEEAHRLYETYGKGNRPFAVGARGVIRGGAIGGGGFGGWRGIEPPRIEFAPAEVAGDDDQKPSITIRTNPGGDIVASKEEVTDAEQDKAENRQETESNDAKKKAPRGNHRID